MPRLPLLLLSVALATRAPAQDQPPPATEAPAPPQTSTMGEAGKIAVRPAQDVGIAKTKVPPILEQAGEAPYALDGTGSCAAIANEIRALSSALGADFDAPAVGKRGSKKGEIAKAGGTALVDSIIPFRGLVREVSGAAAAQRRLEAATYAGFARRGFLRGLFYSRKCGGRP